MKSLGESIYGEWETFVAQSGRPDATKDAMIRAFDQGRQEQVRTWAASGVALDFLSKETREEVEAERRRREDSNRTAA